MFTLRHNCDADAKYNQKIFKKKLNKYFESQRRKKGNVK